MTVRTTVLLLGVAGCFFAGACPAVASDADGDQIPDVVDPCPSFLNTSTLDTNADGIPDQCQCGDTNSDGAITSMDAHNVTACLADPSSCSLDLTIAEADDSGTLTLDDVYWLAEVVDGRSPASQLTCARRPEGTAAP